MRKTFIALSLGLALLLSAASSASAGTLSGEVREIGTSRPLTGAIVSVMQTTNKRDAEFKYQQSVDEQGAYTIPEVAAGTYSITVTYPSLKPAFRIGVKIDSAAPATEDFTLGTF